MSLIDDLQGAAQELEQAGQFDYFEYRGGRVPCIVNTLLRGTTLTIGGKEEEIQLTIFIRKNAVRLRTGDNAAQPTGDSNSPADSGDDNMTPPHPGKRGRLKSRDYRILTVEEDGVGAGWKCHLGSVNQ